jgi:hypothetical protein
MKKEKMFEILRERYPQISENAKLYYHENEYSVSLTVDDRYAVYSIDCSTDLFNGVRILADSYPFADFELSDRISMNNYEDSENYSTEAAVICAKIFSDEEETVEKNT